MNPGSAQLAFSPLFQLGFLESPTGGVFCLSCMLPRTPTAVPAPLLSTYRRHAKGVAAALADTRSAFFAEGVDTGHEWTL